MSASYVAGVPLLSVMSHDPLLHVVAPLALAASVRTALVIDRCPEHGWPMPVGSLQDLVTMGPTAGELRPSQAGVAVVGGPVEQSTATDSLIEALVQSWPAVVIRRPPGDPDAVAVEPALPWRSGADIVVATRVARPAGALPAPPGRIIRAITAGRIDTRWRWFRHWREVWGA